MLTMRRKTKTQVREKGSVLQIIHIMKYLPFELVVYETELSEQEVLGKLSDCVQDKKIRFFRTDNPLKKYEGFIDENTFKISRIIKYRNSFLPQITGTVRNDGRTTQVEVKMQLDMMVTVLVIFCCSMVLLSFLVAVFQQQKLP